MTIWQRLKRPPWRTFLLLIAVLALLGLIYLIWSPGRRVQDGRHDLGSNGIWLQHGWIGDDSWFTRNDRDQSLFRTRERIDRLADVLGNHGIRYVYPHLCPCSPEGAIAPVDSAQTERFLDGFEDFEVMPWVGGVLAQHCSPQSPQWREAFAASCVSLLRDHPRLAGVHINIEPMPSGDASFLTLLEELRAALPEGKILSVAAYPPPTRWHPFPEVHWDEAYFRQVAQRVDQVVPMMYDTAIRWSKPYEQLMGYWTTLVLNWAGDAQVLLGVPVYDDAGVGYHYPRAENLRSALLGIHAGLSRLESLPPNYAGIAIYSEWEMDEGEWAVLESEFLK